MPASKMADKECMHEAMQLGPVSHLIGPGHLSRGFSATHLGLVILQIRVVQWRVLPILPPWRRNYCEDWMFAKLEDCLHNCNAFHEVSDQKFQHSGSRLHFQSCLSSSPAMSHLALDYLRGLRSGATWTANTLSLSQSSSTAVMGPL